MQLMTILLLLSFFPNAHANQIKTRMRACSNDHCKSFVKSADVFKRRYCNARPNCSNSVDKVVMNVMKDAKYPQKTDHQYWANLVKEGEIHVPASKRSDF